MTESALVTAWRQHLAASTPGLHLADAGHPLQLFIGKTDTGMPRMVIRASTKTVKPLLSDVVLIERYEDQSGRWNLSFTLQDDKFREVFLRLVDDLHARSAKALNESTALDRINLVLDEWRRLLRPRPTGLLSMEELRGLVGELWLLLVEFSRHRSIDAAVEGWLGPMGLPQDFWYPDGGFYEAKSIGPATTQVRIASENQLDSDNLELLVLQIGNVGEETAGAFNLLTLVNRVRSRLSDTGSNHQSFDERLERLGVDLSKSLYQDTWFSVMQLVSYEVRADFPAIRASKLDEGVTRVTFQIDIASIEPFKLYSTEVG